MSSIGYSKHLKCFTEKCGRNRPYWSDHCKRCRDRIAVEALTAVIGAQPDEVTDIAKDALKKLGAK